MLNNTIFNWNEEKNLLLKETRGVSFEDVIAAIDRGDLLEIIPNFSKTHKEQSCFVVIIKDYAHMVPFVRSEKEIFLKTIYCSRKYKKLYQNK